ncbi:signal recognition particle receptor FtsY [Clostridiales bacterium]|nr:signal recognition particle receptor FtsY [Clostridiales bacterium]
MGLFDFLKGEEYKENTKANGAEKAVEETEGAKAEETVEEIVHDVVDEIEDETSKKIGDDVVTDVVEKVSVLENEVRADVEKSVANGTECEVDETAKDDEPEAEQPEEEPKKGFFARLKEGLENTKKNIFGGIDAVLGGFTKIDDDLFDELEESLIMADIGVDTTLKIIENLKTRVKKEHAEAPSLIMGMLEDEIAKILAAKTGDKFEISAPSVILVIGVNGVGKTTTIGKLAANYKAEGKSVLLAAADTFRAAAIDQLKIWGERTNTEVICHEENSDPAAVVFDAVNAAKSRNTDILICDTAGRLHNKKNLMEELKKIARVISREFPEANTEVFLVLDATTGQNALQQAKLFNEVADITGLVLTKLDGTAKGGIVIAISDEMNIPVRYIGVGEGVSDLQPFNAEEFSKALFEK